MSRRLLGLYFRISVPVAMLADAMMFYFSDNLRRRRPACADDLLK
jgi:hypothetical protein